MTQLTAVATLLLSVPVVAAVTAGPAAATTNVIAMAGSDTTQDVMHAMFHCGDNGACADETNLYVYDGMGGVLLQVPRSSGTIVEYPVVADVDSDGSAEIIVVKG